MERSEDERKQGRKGGKRCVGKRDENERVRVRIKGRKEGTDEDVTINQNDKEEKRQKIKESGEEK